MASRSCVRSSTGKRLCARALPNALCLMLCARRHMVQRQPLFQPADVPWPAAVTVRTRPAIHFCGPLHPGVKGTAAVCKAESWISVPTPRSPGVVTMWIRAICRTKMGVSVAPGLETWRVPRSMVIIEPEGQERSNPGEPRLKWAAQRSSVIGKIITVAPDKTSRRGALTPRHRQRGHQRPQTSNFP
jgi:hypothetical protein